VILRAIRWYLRYSLLLRDVEELLLERGLAADHTTVWRWVQRYRPNWNGGYDGINKSWRVDETCLKVKGRWCYLYRAIDRIHSRASSTRFGTHLYLRDPGY
jgi:transposase-like protein